MKLDTLPFYYFPTTALLIDDNERFLESISFKLDSQLAYLSYDKPYQALQYLKEDYDVSKMLGQQLLSSIRNRMSLNNDFILDPEKIFDQLYESCRFKEISVVLVDYSMPSMTGLDFCRQIKTLPIKKILVTGEADEELAVKAFNEGIIDKFIRKDNYQFAKEVNRMIADLKNSYFQAMSNVIKKLLKEEICFMNDPIFIEFFQSMCNENNISEYYFIGEVGGFLLIDIDAKPSWLFVRTADDFEKLIHENRLPQMVIDQINNSFGDIPSQGLALLGEKKSSYRTQIFKGNCNYYCTFISSSKIQYINSEEVVSYRDYLGL